MATNATAREKIFALREHIARLEGKPLAALAAAQQADAALDPEAQKARDDQPRLPFGVKPLDIALEGGLPLDGITEIRSRAMWDAGAASGFVLSLAAYLKTRKTDKAPVLWIGDTVSTQEAGAPYAVGLDLFGLKPGDIFYGWPRRLEDALWLAEAAVASGAFAAIILEIRGNPSHFGLAESRRLNLRAKAAGRPLFLMRHAGDEEASSALFRLLIEPAPAAGRGLPDGSLLRGSIGHPIFRTTLEKSRNPAPLSFLLEWNPHDRQFSLGRETAEAFSLRTPPAHSGARLSASADRPDRAQAMGSVVAFERAS